ncbi:molybdopterin-dependent oxidoreductase [Ideonella sp. A 288]|uniref:molybdopterin-dependent oxidoreductase n=1 Tax=Ideonella sp. A 288 TaxID=1962181 RepID=UPI00118579D3|nr:molybdopterin-dependent oxidoreductase [Ideonella sp. A 288]
MTLDAPAGRAWCAAVLWIGTACAAACPADTAPRAADTALVVQGTGPAPWALSSADLAALPPTRLTQRQTVSSATGVASERSLAYSGVLVRDVLAKAGFGGPNDRGARTGIVEAVATDGYRAVYSWGELFNSALGDQVLVITAQDDRPLDAAAGPLALRSLADLRPGPRHVRNLCALVVRR